MLVLKHTFNVMRLHRVDLIVLEANKRAIRSYQKFGFRTEGVLRERALIQGQRQNDLIMAILSHEYRDTNTSAGVDTG